MMAEVPMLSAKTGTRDQRVECPRSEGAMPPGRRRRAFRGCAGFTLIEMLAVLAILTLVAAIALPRLTHQPELLILQTAAQSMVSALRGTRALAIARNTSMRLEVDVDQHTIDSPVSGRQSFPQDIIAKITVAAPERSSSSSGRFRFFPDGSSTGGDVLLRLHGNETRICINWLTGEAREGTDCARYLP